jgi:hypothetical protein
MAEGSFPGKIFSRRAKQFTESKQRHLSFARGLVSEYTARLLNGLKLNNQLFM